MSTETEFKLSEAEYFFKAMQKTRDKNEEFIFNLSAFVSAFRSITLFMQKEFNKTEGFNEWYKSQQKKLKENEYMKLLNEERVTTIHKESLKPTANVKGTTQVTLALVTSVKFTVLDEKGNVIEKKRSTPNGEFEDITKDPEKKVNHQECPESGNNALNNEMK